MKMVSVNIGDTRIVYGEWIEYVVTTGVGCFWQGTRIKRDGLVIAETSTSGTKISLARPSKQVYKEVDLV